MNETISATSRSFNILPDLQLILIEESGRLLQENGSALAQNRSPSPAQALHPRSGRSLMPDHKISELPAAASILDAGITPFVQSASSTPVTRQASDSQLRRAVLADRGVGVRDLGAAGNGTTNDAPAIQAAINSLGAAGGVVQLGPRTTSAMTPAGSRTCTSGPSGPPTARRCRARGALLAQVPDNLAAGGNLRPSCWA